MSASDRSGSDSRTGRLDRLIEWLLIALLAFMPLALGAVEAWSELVVVAAAGVALALLGAKLLVRRDVPVVTSWLFVPLALFAALVALQLVPLPAGVVSLISPETVRLRTEVLSDLPNSDRLLSAMTLSLYPRDTRAALRIFLAAAVMVVVVANVFRTPRQIKRLLAAIVVIGGAVALLALAQIASGTSAIYWTIDTGNPLHTGGTFVNRNNFCQFVNLSIGAAVALMLVQLDEAGLGRRSLKTIRSRLGQSELRTVNVLAGVVVIGAVAVFLSGSRGGMISLLGAFAVVTLLAATRRDRTPRGWILLVLGLVMLVGVLYAGVDVATSRLSTLRDLEEAGGERLEMNRDALAMAPKFAAAGIGLGTHEVVYPAYSTLSTPSVAEYLENEYLQVLEEMGVPGALLLLAFLALLVICLTKVLRQGRMPVHAAAYGIVFAIVAVMIHSATDFGLRLPANALLAAALIGTLISLHRLLGRQSRQGRALVAPAEQTTLHPTRGSWLLRGAALVAGVAIFAWATLGAYRAAAAEQHWNRVFWLADDLRNEDWQGTNEQYAELIGEAAAAVEAEPDNARYRLLLNSYRWQSLTRYRDAQTGAVLAPARAPEFAARIVDELNVARALCPTMGEAAALAGQLELFVLERPDGAERIRLGYRLAPTNPTAAFVAGKLDAREGRWEAAQQKFARAILLGRPAQDVVAVYLDLDRPELALELARDSERALAQLAAALKERGTHEALAQQARARQAELIRANAARSDAPPAALAQMARLHADDQDYDTAAALYRRALAKDYGNVEWRMALARTLEQSGQVPEAMREVRICLRLRPEHAAAKRLLGELSVRPGASIAE